MLWFDRTGNSAAECDPEEKGIVDVRAADESQQLSERAGQK
jgi:hypothetical protein